MTTETPSTEQVTQSTTTPTDLGSLSFADYQKVRRGEALPSSEAKPSAPEAKASEHKEALASETKATEEKEREKTEEESSGDESEQLDTAAKNEQDETKPGKKKGGIQKRFDKLSKEKSEAQREAEYWKKLALETKGATEAKKEPVETKKTEANDGKPKPESFDTHAEYVEALTDWKTDQKLNERDKKAEKNRFESEQSKKMQTYLEKKAAFAEKTPDFDDVIADADGIPVPHAVTQIIVESEHGPELAYELAKNRDEFARICKLPPLSAAREMGKFEAKIAALTSEAKETKKVTNAPKPLDPVGTGKGTSGPKKPEEMSFPEYEKHRREQLRRKRA
jgi:hypothetical protein